MSSENIVITSQMYVGYSQRAVNERLGFATYYEDNAACRKRQATVDKWSSIPAELLDNSPRAGFKLAKSVTHGGGWNDTSTYWRVIDPLGFELEISPGNLGKLFRYCNINQGTLDQECVWGWDKANQSKPVLLPVNSEHYINSVKTTERHNAKSLSLKDLQLGDHVELKNGTKGIFFGLVTYGYYVETDEHERGKIEFDSSYVIKTDQYKQGGELYFVKTPKVIAAKDCKTPYTIEQATEVLNDFVANRKSSSYMAFCAAGNDHKMRNTMFFTYADKSTCKANLVITEMDNAGLLALIRKHGRKKDIAHTLGKFPHYVNPVILKRGNEMFIVSKPADPKYGYCGQAKETDVYRCLNGDSNNMRLKCHKIDTSTPLDAEHGYKLIRNPEYKENDNSYYNRNRPKFLEFEVDLCDVSSAMILQGEFNGIIKDFIDSKN